MSIRVRLLEMFAGKAGTTVSGEILARRLGVSRTAVWKQMKALKNAGVPIDSTGRMGYRFGASVDNSLISFRGTTWTTCHYYLNTSSTQSLAKAGAGSGLAEGHLWVAETQSKGRGRLGRVWESGYGGLWFSLLLRPRMPPARLTPLTLVAGLSLHAAVTSICRIQAKLKWPNDLVVAAEGGSFKKIAGILTEMSGQMEQTEWVAIGVGLNVNNVLSRPLAGLGATLCGQTGKVWPRGKILTAFLAVFREDYARFQKDGFEPFRPRYWRNYFAPDQLVRLRTSEGERSGFARGIDDSGAIMIESRRKMHTFSEGEIVL